MYIFSAAGAAFTSKSATGWLEIASLALKQKNSHGYCVTKKPLDFALQNDLRVILVVPLWLT